MPVLQTVGLIIRPEHVFWENALQPLIHMLIIQHGNALVNVQLSQWHGLTTPLEIAYLNVPVTLIIMLIITLENVFTNVHSKLSLTVQQEIVLKLVLMDGMELIVQEDANKCVLQDNLLIFFFICVFKNVQWILYFMEILIITFVFHNVLQ